MTSGAPGRGACTHPGAAQPTVAAFSTLATLPVLPPAPVPTAAAAQRQCLGWPTASLRPPPPPRPRCLAGGGKLGARAACCEVWQPVVGVGSPRHARENRASADWPCTRLRCGLWRFQGGPKDPLSTFQLAAAEGGGVWRQTTGGGHGARGGLGWRGGGGQPPAACVRVGSCADGPDGRPTRTVRCRTSGAVAPTPPIRWKRRGEGGAFVARGCVEKKRLATLH